MTRPRIVVVTPIAPAPTGNGLAMRCHALVGACAVHHDVALVVVPVAGRLPTTVSDGPVGASPGAITRHDLAPTRPGDRAPLLAWMADPTWRPRLASLAPLPDMVAAAPPTRIAELVAVLGPGNVAAVVGCRLAVAPLSLAVAERYGARLVVDADDDDVAFHRLAHDEVGAQQWSRVAALCLPRAELVLVASPDDREPVARRWDLGRRVVVAPNAVARPARTAPRPGRHRLVFVANFTYAPNGAGAGWFVREVLPLLPPPWQVDLVGAPTPAVAALAGDRVEVSGWVPDISPSYARADVAIVPLHAGSGTRIKVLEAFARRRPVVATTTGAAGIDVRHGEHLLLADDPASFAAAISAASDPETADRLVAVAERKVVETYDRDRALPQLAALISGVTGARADGSPAVSGRARRPDPIGSHGR